MDAATEILLGALSKSTLLLLAGEALVLVARRRSAAARHAIAGAALLAAAAAPILALALPAWRTGLLEPSAPALAAPLRADVAWSPAPADAPSGTTPTPGSDEIAEPLSPAAIALGLWLAGAAVALARAGLAVARTRALVREAAPIRDDRALSLHAAAGRALGVAAVVPLLESPRAATALAAGARRPVVVLPPTHGAWPDDRLRATLFHEMAHVRRRDAALHLATRVAAALLFFHPLARLALRRIERLREHACDDAVLAAGARPSDYASALLAAARDVGAARFALAMARPPVEERLAAVLDGPRDRRPLARRTPLALAGATASLAAAVAAADPRGAILAAGPIGDALQARWTDGRVHVGAFLRGAATFAPDGASVESIPPGGFLLVAAHDEATGALATYLALAGERPRFAASGDGPALASVLPETIRRLRSSPRGDPRISGSTLEGELARTTDGEGRTLLARFATDAGPAGLFARGPLTLSADGRAIDSLDGGSFVVAFVEGARGVEVGIGGDPSSRDVLAAALPAAWRATAGFARDVWRGD